MVILGGIVVYIYIVYPIFRDTQIEYNTDMIQTVQSLPSQSKQEQPMCGLDVDMYMCLYVYILHICAHVYIHIHIHTASIYSA